MLIEGRRMRWGGEGAEGLLGGPRRRQKDSIKMDLRNSPCGLD